MTRNNHSLPAEPMAGSSPKLFDAHGRCTPAHLSSAVLPQTRRRFVCTQPEVDYTEIYERIQRHLGMDAGMSADEFASRAEAVLCDLQENDATSEIANGVRIPFLLPKFDSTEIGTELESLYLTATAHAFREKFPEYAYIAHASGLAGKLTVTKGSRHDRLIDAMRKGPVVGHYFPCLDGYSVPAAIEQTCKLPENLLLSGGFDTCAALIGSPDLLLRTDGYPPLLWLAALSADTPGVGFHFEAYGYNLTFNRRAHLGHAAEYWASGLVALG